MAGFTAALCLTESLGSPLPDTFEVVFRDYYNYALQDLEEMKASAKPAWECVWPSREEEEEE